MATATNGSSAAGKQSAARSDRPFSAKSHSLEPRGRPAKGQPAFSGATDGDPLVSVQILKVRQSVWTELAKAAGERKWHRSVLVRELLDEWFRKRQASKRKTKKAA